MALLESLPLLLQMDGWYLLLADSSLQLLVTLRQRPFKGRIREVPRDFDALTRILAFTLFTMILRVYCFFDGIAFV